MLNFIRSRAQGWFAWVIVGLITVPFALWGIHNYVGGGGATHVAKVAGFEISQSHFENTYQQQRMQLEQMFGGQIPEMFSEQMLRAQVLEQMIEQEMIIQAAAAERMRISDRQLADTIRAVDAFHEGGVFSQELYVNVLRRQGMTPAMFEQRVRRDLLAEQLESSFLATGFVTPAAIDDFIRLDRQQRRIDWLRIVAEDFAGQVQLDEAEIQAYYEANRGAYQTPEQVKVDYLEIRADAIAEAIGVEEEELRLRYEARLDYYRSPEERRASHILIRVDEGASDDAIRSARERAEDLLARIRQGEDFATLASSESDDPGSAQSGGDLGFFGRGLMVASFEDVAFALEPGQVSELVRSPFGFHIIRLEAIRGGELEPYEAVRESLLAEVQQEFAQRQFFDRLEQLTSYTYEQPDTLSIAAEEMGLTIQTSDFLTREGGPGIGAHSRVISAAFSDDVLQRGVNSEPLEIGRDRVIVLRLNQHQPAALRPLDEVRDSIVQALTHQRAVELAQDAAGQLLEQLRAGQSPAQIAETAGVEWSDGITVQRDSQEIESAIVHAAFEMPRPQAAQPLTRQLGLANGDQAVLLLHQVVDGDPAGADTEMRRRAEQILLRAESSVVSDAVLASVRERTDIQIRR